MSRGVVSPGGPGEGLPGRFVGMWSGPADEIPEGWALCDGTGGTPDLRGRFVLGAGGSYAVGATGGEEKHTLTVAEMPSHSHDIGIANGSSSTSRLSADIRQSKWSSVESTGGSQAHNNMPPYYALCYIMKL